MPSHLLYPQSQALAVQLNNLVPSPRFPLVSSSGYLEGLLVHIQHQNHLASRVLPEDCSGDGAIINKGLSSQVTVWFPWPGGWELWAQDKEGIETEVLSTQRCENLPLTNNSF